MRFEEFNGLYFGGRLPPYRIAVLAELKGTGTVDASGYCDRRRRLIRLRHESEDAMVGTLLHEMVHAATGDWHGKKFQAEIQRLHAAGAPVATCDLAEPRRVTAAGVRCGIEDAMNDGATLRQAQTFVAHAYGLTRAALRRRFPKASALAVAALVVLAVVAGG